MGPAGPAEVPGAGSVAIGRTQLDRLLRVIPKPASVSMNQLRLAASIAGQDQVSLWHATALGRAWQGIKVPVLCSLTAHDDCGGSTRRPEYRAEI